MNVVYRRAQPDDAPACVTLRGKTRENAFSVEQLRAIGITVETWRAEIANGTVFGYAATLNRELIGYCFGDTASGEVIVLALLPDYEGNGHGKALLTLVICEFKRLGFTRLFLGCSSDPKVRSHGFYRHLGWRSTGGRDSADDEVLEYFP